MGNMDTSCGIIFMRLWIIVIVSCVTGFVIDNSLTIYHTQHDTRSAIVQAVLLMSLIMILSGGAWLKINEERDREWDLVTSKSMEVQEEHVCDVTRGSDAEKTSKNKQIEFTTSENKQLEFTSQEEMNSFA